MRDASSAREEDARGDTEVCNRGKQVTRCFSGLFTVTGARSRRLTGDGRVKSPVGEEAHRVSERRRIA
jgi:hypothetical protein